MLWIHWWDVHKDRLADGRLLRPDTLVRLRSEHHLDPPSGYVIHQVVPKFLQKWRGSNMLKITRMEAYPSYRKRLASVYWSEEWPLAGPVDQTREVVYQPELEGEAGHSVEAFKVRCAYIFVSKLQHSAGADFRLKPALTHSSSNVSLGEAKQTASSVTTFEAAAPVDPRIEISLLQGSELLSHLVRVSEEFTSEYTALQSPVEKGERQSSQAQSSAEQETRSAGKALFGHASGPDPRMVSEMRRLQERVKDLEAELERLQEENEALTASRSAPRSFLQLLPGAVATYFAGEIMPSGNSPFTGILDPGQPLRIEVGAPQLDNLRAAFSVAIRDVETGNTTISDPVFLTSVHGRVIATDLPVELMKDDSRRILVAAAGVQDEDIVDFAQSLNLSKNELWDRLVEATQELGAASVDEAVEFVAFVDEDARQPVLV